MEVGRLVLSFLPEMGGFKRTKGPYVLQVRKDCFLCSNVKTASIPTVKTYCSEPPECPPQPLQPLPWLSSSTSP